MTDRLPKARCVPDTKAPKEVDLSPNIFPLGVRHSAHSKKADCSLDSEPRRSLWSQEGVKLLERLGPHIYCIICPINSFGKLPLGWPNMSKAISSSKNRSNQALYIPLDFPGGSDGKASVYNVRDLGSIPGLGRFPGEGNGNPLQYSCLENPMDGGAW